MDENDQTQQQSTKTYTYQTITEYYSNIIS